MTTPSIPHNHPPRHLPQPPIHPLHHPPLPKTLIRPFDRLHRQPANLIPGAIHPVKRPLQAIPPPPKDVIPMMSIPNPIPKAPQKRLFPLFFRPEIGIVEKGGVPSCLEHDLRYHHRMGSRTFPPLGVPYRAALCKGDMGLVVGAVKVFAVPAGGEGEGG